MIAPSALLDSPPPAPNGAEPPGSPPDTPFSTVLDDHQARTAVAEGPQTQTPTRRQGDVRARDARDSQPSVRDDGTGSTGRADRDDASTGSTDRDTAHDGDGAPAQPAATPAALAALLGGVPLPAGVATAIVAARLPLATSASPRAATASPAPGLPGAPAQTGAMPTGPAVPAAATALPLGPAAGQPAAGAVGTPSNAPADGAPTGTSALPSGLTAVADALQAPAARPAAGAAKATPAAAAAAPVAAPGIAADPSAASGSTATGTPSQQAPAAQAAQPAPTTAAVALPATPPAGAQATAPADGAGIAGGVGLEHAVETVRLALSAAADRGVTHARISLNPRELGSIEVHLRQTADGLVARVVAQHAGAAQLLQNAGGDLRRALESQGLNLLSLDIGASGEQSGGAADRQALANGAAGDRSGGRGGQDASDDPLAALDPTADQTTTTTTLALANGALVDVLA